MKQLELQQKIWELIATEHSHLNYLKTVINVSHHCICYHAISSCVCLCVVCCVSVCCVLCLCLCVLCAVCCVLCVAIHAEFGAYQKGSSSCGGKCQACVVQSPVLLTPPFPSLFSVISHLPNVTKYLHGHHLITFAISSLHHLIPPPPHPSTTSSLHHLIPPPPHPSITSSLHHLIPPPPHPSTTSSLHHLIPPPPHRSTTSSLLSRTAIIMSLATWKTFTMPTMTSGTTPSNPVSRKYGTLCTY